MIHSPSVEREEIFLLNIPCCLNTGLFLSLPSKMNNFWDTLFPASASIFSTDDHAAGTCLLFLTPRKLSRAWAQMVKGRGDLVLTGPPTHHVALIKAVPSGSPDSLKQRGERPTLWSPVDSIEKYEFTNSPESPPPPPHLSAAGLSSPSGAHSLMSLVKATVKLPSILIMSGPDGTFSRIFNAAIKGYGSVVRTLEFWHHLLITTKPKAPYLASAIKVDRSTSLRGKAVRNQQSNRCSSASFTQRLLFIIIMQSYIPPF